MKVTVIPIVISAPGTVTKGLIKDLEDLEIRGRAETIQTTALLRLAWILRRVLETQDNFPSLKRGCEKNSLKSKLIINKTKTG